MLRNTVGEEHFYTSALATAEFLKRQSPGCSAYVIGEAGLSNALYDAGITMNEVDPDYVVVGEGKTYSLDTLNKAVDLVMKGVSNLDTPKTYAYRPTAILDGVGDIVRLAKESK